MAAAPDITTSSIFHVFIPNVSPLILKPMYKFAEPTSAVLIVVLCKPAVWFAVTGFVTHEVFVHVLRSVLVTTLTL